MHLIFSIWHCHDPLLGLFRSYLPHLNSESHTIFFMDSLFFKEYSIKISNFFLISSTSPQSFSSARVHWSMSEFRALRIVSIISLSSKFRIMHHFFYGLLVLQGILFQNFKFFLNQLHRSPKFQFSQSSLDYVWIRSTWACFDHISLIRTWNHIPFFLWTPCSSRNIISKFQFFSQPAQLVPKVSV